MRNPSGHLMISRASSNVTVQRPPIDKTSHSQTAVAGFVYRAIFDGYYLGGRWTVTKILNSKKNNPTEFKLCRVFSGSPTKH